MKRLSILLTSLVLLLALGGTGWGATYYMRADGTAAFKTISSWSSHTGDSYFEALTSSAHGFTTGDTVSVGGVTGTTTPNGTWTVTVIDTTHFTIPLTYASGASGGKCIEAGPSSSAAKCMSVTTCDGSTTFADGDEIIISANAGNYSTQFTPPYSATSTPIALIGEQLVKFGATIPSWTPGVSYGIVLNNKNNVNIIGLRIPSIQVEGTSTGINIYCANSSGSSTIDLYWTSSGSGTIYNWNGVGSTGAQGIYVNNATANVKVRNSIIAGNYNTGLVNNNASGTLDVDYCLIAGNAAVPPETFANITFGDHNITEANPCWYHWPIGQAYFSMSTDDSGVGSSSHSAHAWNVAQECDLYHPSTPMFTYFMNTGVAQGYAIQASDITNCNYILADGHDIGNHTQWHDPMNCTTYPNLFKITTTNSGTNTINVDETNMQVVLTSSGTPANNFTYNFTGAGGHSISDWVVAMGGAKPTDGPGQTASVTAKGWTITLGFGNPQPGYTYWATSLYSATDTGGAQTIGAGYTVTANGASPYRFYSEQWTTEANAWFAANLTGAYVPTTCAYPYGLADSGVESWLQANTSIVGARGYKGTYACDFLNSVNIYYIGNYTSQNILTASWTGSSGAAAQSTIMSSAAHLYVYAMCLGCGMNVLTHEPVSDMSPAQVGYMLQQFKNMGDEFTYTTIKGYIAAIKADHTTSDNITYTKTYTPAPDYRLKSNSPCIKAGTSGGWTTDITGWPIKGDTGGYPIGPYAYRGAVGCK